MTESPTPSEDQADTSTGSKIWDNVVKISIVLGAIAAFIAIWQAFNGEESGNVHLRIEASPYELPQKIEDTIFQKRYSTSYEGDLDKISDLLAAEDLDLDGKYKIISAAREIQNQKDEVFEDPAFDSYRGIVFLELKNSGGITANNVNVDIPEEGLAQVTLPDGTETTNQFQNTINIGNLRAGTTAKATVWTTSELSRYSLDEINVTHATGKGSVSWPATTSHWYTLFLEDHPLLSLYLFMGVVVILLKLTLYYLENKYGLTEKESESS